MKNLYNYIKYFFVIRVHSFSIINIENRNLRLFVRFIYSFSIESLMRVPLVSGNVY